MSKRTVRSVKKSCDRLWSQVVRAPGRCERCGTTPEAARGFHPHHVYGRSNHRLRWELRNGIALCAACHRWAHNTPLEFSDWFWGHRPNDASWLVHENQNGLIKRTLQDYLDLESTLKAELAMKEER